MSEEMQVYEVFINGISHTVQLDKKTAELWGVTTPVKAAQPANKSRAADNK